MSLTTSVLQKEPGRFGLWPAVGKLLRLRVRIWFNTFTRSRTRAKVGSILLWLFLLGLIIGVFFLSRFLLSFLDSPELAQYVNPATFLASLPTLILTAAFFLTILTNFGILLQALYLSHDMDFLVTSPLPMRAVFLAKLLEAILPNFALFCAFALPVMFGMGSAKGYSLLYYPLLVIVLALLALAAGGLASILVMAVVRVIPARRVAEVLGLLGAVLSVLIGQSGNLINTLGVRSADLRDVLGLFSRLNAPWSPLAWAGNGLTAIGRGDWLPGFGLTLLALGLASALFLGTLFLAENLYYTGWTSMQGSIRKKRPARGTPPASQATAASARPSLAEAVATTSPSVRLDAATEALSPFPFVDKKVAAWLSQVIPVRGLLIKDLLLLRRDPRNLSQLITPLILGFVLIFTSRSRSSSNTNLLARLPGGVNIGLFLLLGMTVFISWMLLTNLAPLAFSREGRNYWILKTTPIRPLQLASAKYLASFLPCMAIGLIFLIFGFAIQGVAWALFPFSAAVVTLCLAGATGIALAFGIAGANLEWDSPHRQRLSGLTGCVMIIAVIGFLGIDLGLFLLPVAAWQIFNSAASWPAYLIGLALGGAASVAAAILPVALVLPRLARIGDK